MSGAFFRALAREAAARYPARDRFARHFAYGKLTGDPVFRELLERGLVPPAARLLDVGCGQGVLEALLIAARARHAQGGWPAGWPPPPEPKVMRGVDIAQRDIERARAACAAQAVFQCEDMRRADFGEVDTVVILDVLHYVPLADQDEVLRRIVAALSPPALLLLRVGDRSSGLRFRFTEWVDRAVMRARGHRIDRLHSRTLDDWREYLGTLGFRVEAVPMSAGTPFANVLLIARYDGR